MQQNNTTFNIIHAGIAFLACLSLLHCSDPPCTELSGNWTNREGQSFQFLPGGKALWLIRFGSQVDTFRMEYRYNCKKQPAELDLSGFQSGPLKGKTLYGILEWSNDSSFRFDSETGYSADVRPSAFENDQTQKFFREN